VPGAKSRTWGMHLGHRDAAHGERRGEAGPNVKRCHRHRGRGEGSPEADAVALDQRLPASPGVVEDRRPIVGRGGTDRRRRSRVERPLRQPQHVAPGIDPLDVDADLAIARDRDQDQPAGVAEVEAQAGGGIRQRRLAVLAAAQLDRGRLLVQVVGEDLAQRTGRTCPVGLGAPDVHLVRRHGGEDT
jgi:hypothetical protein